jgi:endonuclease/exonuclease/phosphatase family metal-dependent hydrolase
MTFNVRGAYRDRGRRNAWPNRVEANVDEVLSLGPDLFGVQEFQWGNFEVYKERLPGYAYVLGPPYGNRRPYDWNAIFFDPGRLEPVDTDGFWLSETPYRRSRSWSTRVVRSANLITFRRPDGSRLVHLNTHLDHVSPQAKLEGARLVIQRLTALPELPTVVTGDFNCRPGSEPYDLFGEAGFVDTYLAAGNEDTQTSNSFHAFRGGNYRDRKEHPAPRRLDWILLRDPEGRARVESCRIVTGGGAGGVYPSDHYPVVAELEL